MEKQNGFGSLQQMLAPQGLSKEDCLRITEVARSTAPEWHIGIHEDAFNQPYLTVAPNRASSPIRTHRLQDKLTIFS